MSIGGIALWSSNYAYEIMGAKQKSLPVIGANPQEYEISANEKEPSGIKPRIDKYTPDNKPLEDPKAEKESKDKNTKQYSQEEQKQIDELKARDNEVRTHEQAHVAAGGAHISSGVSYTMQTAPDGKQYAIGGEVNIDTSPVKDSPEATITKMQTVRAAALAPASPSDADRAVAAAASQTEASARAQLAEESRSQNTENETPEEENPQIKSDENTKNIDKVNNQIANAISAYTNNYATNFSSKLNIAV